MKESMNTTSTSGSEEYLRGAWQAWHKKGQRCPKGTVPIRRSKLQDVLRANSLYDFGKKRHRRGGVPLAGQRSNAPDVVSGNGHEVCIFVCRPSSKNCHYVICCIVDKDRV